MDSIIPLGQKNTLAEYMILSGADNRPPMLDKDLYDSWKSESMVERSLNQSKTVNTKFLNNLPPEWSKFVTDVKLVKDLHTTNFDQLKAYLEQHDIHADEYNTYSSSAHQQAYAQPLIEYVDSPVHHQSQQAEFPQLDTGLAAPVFKPGDDPIDAINKMMPFLSTVITSRFPSTNNQLRNSSNPRQQETIQDGKVTVQQVQGRQGTYAAGTSGTRAITTGSGGRSPG
ncbi:hypothetical protein Tco_0265528 [Tanacetum coccineum]